MMNSNNYEEDFNGDELEVASILLHLSNLPPRHQKDDEDSSFPSCSSYYNAANINYRGNNKLPLWVGKRRRSVLDSPPPPFYPPPPPPPLSHTVKIIPEVTSPSTPLSFLPSPDSPPPPPQKRKSSSRLTIEKLKEAYEEAILTQNTLKQEIQTVQSHKTGLEAEHQLLKAQLEKWRGLEEEGGRVGGNDEVHAAASTSTQVNDPTPLIIQTPRVEIQKEEEKKVGPWGFDLNIAASAEEEEEGEIPATGGDVEERERMMSDAEIAKLNRLKRILKMKESKQLRHQQHSHVPTRC